MNEMLSSCIIFLVSFAAFSTSVSKSPSLFTQISIPIDSKLPAPRPSPACQQRTLCGKDCIACLSSTCQRSEEHTSELQSRGHLVCRLLLEKKKKQKQIEIGGAHDKDTKKLTERDDAC